MMTIKIIRTAALVIAAALAGVPALSQAATAQATAPVHVNYDMTLSTYPGFSYPWSGTLQLTINSDGIIQGYYRPADNMAFEPVTGGQNGDNVWLDIGSSGRLHVNGVIRNGAITGGAVDEQTFERFTFSAKASS